MMPQLALKMLGRPQEAVKDWNRAVELSPPAEQPKYRASRLISQLDVGMLREALADVVELTNASNWSAEHRYAFACVYATAGSKFASRKQEYANRAIEELQQAVKGGFKNVERLKRDPHLNSLRERADFQKLISH